MNSFALSLPCIAICYVVVVVCISPNDKGRQVMQKEPWSLVEREGGYGRRTGAWERGQKGGLRCARVKGKGMEEQNRRKRGSTLWAKRETVEDGMEGGHMQKNAQETRGKKREEEEKLGREGSERACWSESS